MKIFISYRRADSKYVVDRIRDRLIDAYDENAVFRDIESIPPGQNFSDVLKEATTSCDVMLVIIGPQWTSVTDDQGKKRLFEPQDYTRLEVEAGLANKKILVIPVLVMNARMPSIDEIPESLWDLRYRNAVNVRNDPDFNPDMQRLIEGINAQFPSITKKERKTMDSVTLAATATTLLMPFLKKAGAAAMDKLAEQLPDAIGKVWNAILNKSSGAAETASDIAQNPDDAENEVVFKKQLQKVIEKDPSFASLLTDLVEKAKSVPSDPSGGDTVTANNNSIAVGKISVGGNVNGNFVIGNNNQVGGK
jgi:hypothetical protein